MSRFKELNRIERALTCGNGEELVWARRYCEARLRHAWMKEHQKHWNRLLNRILRKQTEAEDD